MALHATAKGGSAWHWFFLAMANWELGNKVEARRWYDQAVAWMETNAVQGEELKRIRAEANNVLNVKNK
jgi:hypothetical protein